MSENSPNLATLDVLTSILTASLAIWKNDTPWQLVCSFSLGKVWLVYVGELRRSKIDKIYMSYVRS
jgi:hypothetical protein